VLVDEPTSADISHLAQALGVPAQVFVSTMYGEDRTFWDEMKIGKRSEADHWAYVERTLGLSASQMQWLNNQFDNVVVRPALTDYLVRVKDSLRLALVSNAVPSYGKTWTRLGFGKLFDVMMNSSEVGVAKPDLRIFEMMINRLGIDPAECAFVDDQVKNVEAASRAGLRAILYESEAQTIAAIDALRDQVPSRADAR
jgi:epoxide hydrolase-like predicted phosphatase